MPPRISALLALLLGPMACDRDDITSRERAAPSASVVTISVALASCDDIALCEKECNSSSGEPCRRLAATYAFGTGVERDQARAAALYERGCDAKDAPSCVFAGQMREFAHGVSKDDAAAAHLYERACDMQWAAGCYNLAIMVEGGRGVPADPARARELYGIACRAGAKVACDKARDRP